MLGALSGLALLNTASIGLINAMDGENTSLRNQAGVIASGEDRDWFRVVAKVGLEIWAIRIRLQLSGCTRELALFNLGIDSKLRACDLVGLHVRDICHGNRIAARAIVLQQKTHRPVQFEITEQTRQAVESWMLEAQPRADDFVFPNRSDRSCHLSTRQYARIVRSWVTQLGLDPSAYATHSMRRTRRR
jgi:integrase